MEESDFEDVENGTLVDPDELSLADEIIS